MKTHAIVFLMSLCMMSCTTAQESEKVPSVTSEKGINSTTNQPRVSWKVNKEVDDDGNIIRYDSTYTWSYSNIQGDSMSVDVDSVMQSFNSYFDQHFHSTWGNNFNSPFKNDSLFPQDFFNDNYFHNRWKNDLFDMSTIFHEMDSVRNRFFDEAYPGLMPPRTNDE